MSSTPVACDRGFAFAIIFFEIIKIVMENNNSFRASILLDKTIKDWKSQPQHDFEIRACKLTPLPNKRGNLTLELSIVTDLLIMGHKINVSSVAPAFITTTLATASNNTDYKAENNLLKHVMKELDEEFYRKVAIEKAKHTPQNDMESE